MFTSSSNLSTADLHFAIVRAPIVVSVNTTVMEAIALMSGVRSQCAVQGMQDAPTQEFHQSVRASCVLVVEAEQVIGILTERDIVRLSAQQQNLEHLLVRQVMAHPVMTLRESAFTDLFSTINLLQQSHIRHLPILDGQDHLVGLVTHESLRHIARPIDLLRLRSVTEVMTRNVVCATPDAAMLAIAQQMMDHRVSSVVIVEVDGDTQRPVGILTERDLVQFQALGLNLQTSQAEAFMSTPVFSVPPGESLWAVQQVMEQRLIHRLVVVGDRQELLGIITQTSILKALNPLELYNLATVLESRISHLEAEKLSLLATRANELEQQVVARTAALKLKAAREKLVAQIATRIRNSLDLQAILDTCVSEVLAFLECDRVLVYQFAPDWSGQVIAEAVQPGWLSALGNQINDSCFQQQATSLFVSEQPLVINNIDKSGYAPCHIQLLERYQVKANLVVPIWVTGKLWGLLIGHQCADCRDWQEEDLSLLQDIAVQLAIALQQATTYQQLQAELQARQQAEIDLRQSQQRYATLVAAAPVGIYRTDAAGDCIYVNDRYCQITGLTPETSLGQGWQQGLHPADRAGLVAEWQHFVQHRYSFRMEYRFRHPDGTVRWVYGQAIAERNDQGQVVGYVGTITDISDRRRSEEALQKSEAHQRALMSALPDLIMRVNRDGYYLECVTTPSFPVVGLPGMVGATIMNTLPPDVAQSRLTYMHLALETQKLQIYEQDFVLEGKRYLEEVRVVPYSQDEVLLLVRDISDRKQAELALKQSEAKSRAILAAIPDLMLRVGADGVYRGYATDRHQSDLTPASIDPTGYRLTQLLPESMATQHLQYLEQALQTGELQVFEQQIDLGDRVQDEEVRVVKSDEDEVLFMIRDITDRKRAEAERLLAEKARLDLDLLEQIFNVVLAGYWDWDIPSNYEYLSPGFKRMFGYEDHELPNSPESWQKLIFPEDLSLTLERFTQHVQSRGQVPFYNEVRYHHKDGSTIWVLCSGKVIEWDEEGNPRRAIGCHIDITERKQAEAQLQRTNEELARATRLKDEFLANMSHELRTPLNAILGMTEGLQEQVFGPITTRQHTALQTIDRSGSHLLELINDILDVAKIESGQIELSYASTGVAGLCQSSLTFIKEQALKKQIQLETKLPPNLPNLLVDERRIRQVLINLLNNAVKFTPEEGRITLEASYHHQTARLESPELGEGRHYLRIAITDTGIGIAPEHLPKLFQPFIQIDSALNRQYQGTGLGLALVKRIVELHGGKVGVTSQEGVGSCFMIDLPCTPTARPLEPLQPLPEMVVEDHQTTLIHAPLILLAEDNEANISTVSSYLKAKGYRIVLAKNGEEAIAQAQSERPDLILMDIQMPGVDGLQAIQRIRQDQTLEQMPIVALTALAMPGDRERCIAAGANDYVSKPIKLKQLTLTIQQLLAVN